MSNIDFPGIIEGLRKSPDGHKRLEQVIIRLLGRLASEEKKTLEVNEGSGFDAVAPAGLQQVEGPAIIDISYRLKRIRGPRYLTDLAKYALVRNAKSVLLIAAATPDPDRISFLQAQGPDKLPGLKIHIWGPEELLDLLQRFPDAVADMVPEVGGLAMAAIISGSTQPWEEQQSVHINVLRQRHLSDKLSLFVGAGVSKECEVPVWKKLISGLAVHMVQAESPANTMTEHEQQVIAKGMVESQESSPLIVARYLESSLGNRFTASIAAVLYRNVKHGSESKLLAAISRLCRPTRVRTGVVAVVSYNFDTLLEEAIAHADLRCKPIFDEGVIPLPDELPIYHVHGMLDRPDASESTLMEVPDEPVRQRKLVFSEEGYLSLQAHHYSWANFEQLKLLRETTCLLIGLSGTDPNLRRLLDVDKGLSKQDKHYIILRRQTVEDLLGPDTVNANVAQHYLNVHHGLQERSFLSLGLKVLWVKSHEEIPALLDQISNESTGQLR